MLYTIKKKTNWIGHKLRRNCRLGHVAEGNIEGRTELKGRRYKQLLYYLKEIKETRGHSKLKYESLDHTLLRIRFKDSMFLS
jgi:hypothetical protein